MTSQACRCCGRSLAEMTPIGSAGGLEYRHCACGNTRTTIARPPAIRARAADAAQHEAMRRAEQERAARRLVLAVLAESPDVGALAHDLADAYGFERCDTCGGVLTADGECPDGCVQPYDGLGDGTGPVERHDEREARRAARRMAEADIG